jgi:hypothetical protein
LDAVAFGQKSKVNDDSVTMTIKPVGAPTVPWAIIIAALVGGVALVVYLAYR